MKRTLFLFCLLVSVWVIAITYSIEFATVLRWQAEGLEAWRTYAVSTWQEWWTYNPYKLALYCWNSLAAWFQIVAAAASIYGAWRAK